MKKFLTLILSLLLVCSSLPAMAEVVEEVNLAGGALQVRGIIPEEADDNITITILAENAYWTSASASLSGNSQAVSLEDYSYSNGDDIFDYLAWYGQFTPDSDGSYCLTIADYTGPSNPEIRIRLTDNSYYYYSPRELIEVNSASSSQELEAAYRSSSFLWNAISDTYEKLDTQELKTAFWQGCLDYKNSLENKVFSSFNEAIDAADAGYFSARLALCQDRSTLEALYEELASAGNVTNSYDIYISSDAFARADGIAYMNEGQKTAFADHMLNNKKDFVTPLAFVNAFNEKIVLYAVSSSQSKELVAEILEKSSFLSSAIPAYASLGKSDKLEVAELVNGQKPYASIDALKKAVDEFCSLVTAAPSGGNVSGKNDNGGKKAVSVGSGGSSAGSGSVAVIPDASAECPFTDIGDALWAKEAITELYACGIVNGRSANTFDPMGEVTRAEFVKMLVLAFGGFDENASSSFYDSKPGDWHYGYISTAVSKGLVNGVGDGSFGANNIISRQDMAVIIARALGGDTTASESGFSDDYAVSDYAKGAVAFVRDEAIMNGVGENTFEPLSAVTRAQAAKVIYEILKRGDM